MTAPAYTYLKRHQRARARRINVFCAVVMLIGIGSIVGQVW
jgi:hypothetical protein